MSVSLCRLRKIVQQIESQNSALSPLQSSNRSSYHNQTVTLKKYPQGHPERGDFDLKSEVINASDLKNGDILVQIKCISIDAYLRTTMYDDTLKEGLHELVGIGGTLHSLALGQVVESKSSDYRVGDYVYGGCPVAKYAVFTSDILKHSMLEKCVPLTNNTEDLRFYLTYLGIATGCSAYAGACYVTKDIKKGDIAVVNAASGAVGSIVCQLYRNKGAKVIAITGGADKKQYLLNTLKLYQCIDYKSENIGQKLKEYAPNGFDVAFDNVGGPQLDVLMNNLNMNAQIVVCGAVSQYSDGLAKNNVYGPKNYLNLVSKNAELKGFNMFAYFDRVAEIRADLMKMVKNKTLLIREVPIYGLDNFSQAMTKLLMGDKNGKILLYP